MWISFVYTWARLYARNIIFAVHRNVNYYRRLALEVALYYVQYTCIKVYHTWTLSINKNVLYFEYFPLLLFNSNVIYKILYRTIFGGIFYSTEPYPHKTAVCASWSLQPTQFSRFRITKAVGFHGDLFFRGPLLEQ